MARQRPALARRRTWKDPSALAKKPNCCKGLGGEAQSKMASCVPGEPEPASQQRRLRLRTAYLGGRGRIEGAHSSGLRVCQRTRTRLTVGPCCRRCTTTLTRAPQQVEPSMIGSWHRCSRSTGPECHLCAHVGLMVRFR
jgi:hypothetical protein